MPRPTCGHCFFDLHVQHTPADVRLVNVQIPTSVRTKEQAESLGIPLCTLNEASELDVAIDGADSVDPDMVCRHSFLPLIYRSPVTPLT
jgi:ribose 5-phosphate isomerase